MSNSPQTPYWKLLKDPRWQKKRLEILNRDEWACSICQDTEKELQIHHNRYEYGKPVWEYDDKDLITLCCDCHKTVTEAGKEIKAMLSFEPALCCFRDVMEILKTKEWSDLCGIVHHLKENPQEISPLYEKYSAIWREKRLKQRQEQSNAN